MYPPFHRHLESYATYAITLSRESLQEVIEILREANLKWDKMVALPAPSSPRVIPVRILNSNQTSSSSVLSFLQWSNRALIHTKFDLILLHPALFLPRGQHLVALKTLEPPTYADWAVIDRELRERGSPSDSAPYPPFSYTSRKDTVLNYVNPFLLILNAGLKLRHHEKDYGFAILTDRQLELVRLTLEAYDLIYYRPPNFTVELPPTAIPSVPTLPRQTGGSSQVPCTSSSANEDDSATPGSMSGSDQMAMDGMHSDDDERSDSGSESNSDLLTRDESSMILARLCQRLD